MSKHDSTTQLTKASDMGFTIKGLLSARGRNPSVGVKSPSIVNKVIQDPSARRHLVDKAPRKTATVLAIFDVETAAIRTNEALLHAMSRNQRTRYRLCDDDVEALVHAFAHALRYGDIFEALKSPRERAKAMMRRRNQDVTRASEESYTNFTLLKERQAEEWVQMVRMELLSSFDRSGHGPGLSEASIANKAEEFAAEWVRELRGDYASKAKDEYRHVGRDGPKDRSRNVGIDVAFAGPAYKRLPVQDITWLLPVDQSATLSKLVDLMVKYTVDIVVPDSRPGSSTATQ